MIKNDQKSRKPVDERYGVPVYQTNPSVPSETEIKRSRGRRSEPSERG